MATHAESLRPYQAIHDFNRLTGLFKPGSREMQRERQRRRLEVLEALVHAVVDRKPQALEIFMAPYGRVETPILLSIRDERVAVKAVLGENWIQMIRRRVVDF